jgi:hypothetical protein
MRSRPTLSCRVRGMGDLCSFTPAWVGRWSQERNEPPGPDWRAAPQVATPKVHGTGTVIGFPRSQASRSVGGKPTGFSEILE